MQTLKAHWGLRALQQALALKTKDSIGAQSQRADEFALAVQAEIDQADGGFGVGERWTLQRLLLIIVAEVSGKSQGTWAWIEAA